MISITRRETFSAAHQLYNPAWSPAQNERIFGSDARLHGHTYVLEVTVQGEIDPETGMVMDLRDLRDCIRRVLIAKLDHSNLNSDVDFLRGQLPSAENIAVACWRELLPALSGARLARIRLWESENNSVEYQGE